MSSVDTPIIVAVLPCRRSGPGRSAGPWEIGVMSELSAIRGAAWPGESPSVAASRVLRLTAGFSVLPGALRHLGVCRSTAGADIYHLFAADVSREQQVPGAPLVWTCLTGEKIADPLVYVMAVRAEVL